MLIGNQIGQVRSTCYCLRKSNNSSVFSGKNAGKFHMFSMSNCLQQMSDFTRLFYLIVIFKTLYSCSVPKRLYVRFGVAIDIRLSIAFFFVN